MASRRPVQRPSYLLGRGPRRVAVIGAGVVGLSVARSLQERDVDVEVLEGSHVAAGASWGNAGWLTPALTTPLAEPSVLRTGLRTVLSPSSPVYVPLRPDPRLLRFLSGFARHCTPRRWESAMQAYAPMNEKALAAYDELVDSLSSHLSLWQRDADPFLECFRTEAERDAALHQLRQAPKGPTGTTVQAQALTGEEARQVEPALSQQITAAIALSGQRFIDPPAFMQALGDAVVAEGVKLVEGIEVASIVDRGGYVVLTGTDGAERRYDAVVVATGAALGKLTRDFGVRQLVQAGRGYSFSVTGEQVPKVPLYFSSQRVACTPISSAEGPRLRVAGMMEFRAHGAPLDRRRIQAIVSAARPLLDGVDLDTRQDEWVGSRPCTADGLPLIGATTSPLVHVAGGHGMWGVVWGPLTGRLVADNLLSGRTPSELVPFDPLR